MIFFIFIFAALAFLVALQLKFFVLDWTAEGKNPVRFWHVIAGHAIYLGISIALPLVLFFLFRPSSQSINLFGGSSFLIVVLLSSLCLWLFVSKLKKEVKTKIFGPPGLLPHWQSFGFGALSYLVAFPISAFVSFLINLFTTFIWPNYEAQEQVAIMHLKMLSNYPIVLVLTILCFAIIVPIIEEFLFRGLLQSWLKNYLSRLWSVIGTAVIFGFFHFSKMQGLANIDLVITLSVLGFFLGFVYEKKGSLWAPIGLHVIFNSISVCRILYEIFW